MTATTFVQADTTDTVAATVTAVIYSVSLNNGDGIAFGNVAQSDTKDTTTGAKGVNDTTTATNNGSVSEKLNIMSTDSTGGSGWTLAADPGSETFAVNFCITDCDSSPAWSTVGISPSYEVLKSSVAKDGTQDFDLQIETPTSTTETTQQSITVTVQAASL